MSTAFDPVAIFAALVGGDVEFVVIGGWAAGAQYAGWPTYDVDIAVETSTENLTRLATVLEELRAVYGPLVRSQPIRPTVEKLTSLSGPQLFSTKHGRLDVLKEVDGGDTYESLIHDAVRVEQSGLSIRCASLPALLRMKTAAGRPKDLRVIPDLVREIEKSE